ncbi:hypothetical protein, partial [Lentzea sp. NPDC004782]|uniref:hypothetical protein n=1 Tax=Lentzea sp. NPDC004782 TaxID=3154458 RepID=UPI0033A898A7
TRPRGVLAVAAPGSEQFAADWNRLVRCAAAETTHDLCSVGATSFPIVNALGELDDPNVEDLTVDDRVLTEAKASGLTAVTVTIGYTWGDEDPYEHTVRGLDVWDEILAAHPDHLLQVPRADDIMQAHTDASA